MAAVVSEIGNPFPGLRSFELEQAHLFFGRDEQIRDLAARLKQHRFLPIVGVSGSGKSSLVRAGLIPTLTGTYVGDDDTSGWRIAVLRPGSNPMHELAATLCRLFDAAKLDDVLDVLRSSSAGLARVAEQHLGKGEKLLVLVDQFEELFRYRQGVHAAGETYDDAAFVKLLLAAAGESEHPLPGYDELPVYVVTTMRSDFLGECSHFRGLPEALNQSQYLIPRLTREQQRDVIEGPVGMVGASIHPALVQRLLNDLGDNPDQLPALQHALMRSWEQSAPARAEGKPIAVADYEAVGTMADALNRDADRVYESLSADKVTATITRRLFQRLVQPATPGNETRSPTTLLELVAVTATGELTAAHAGELKRIINVFQERGFLTVSSDENPIVDIPHESLIRGWKQLTKWVQEEARSAAIYRRLADHAALYANKEALLLVDPQLQVTLNWAQETKPNEAWATRYDPRYGLAAQFLEQSADERDYALEHAELERRRKLKRARVIAAVLGSLLLLAIAASVFAIIQLKRAREERDRSSRLLYDSNVYFASGAMASGQFTLARERLDELLDPNLRELRAFEWFHLWRSANADEVTLSGHTGSVNSAAFSPDGKILATGSADSTVKLWDTATWKELATLSVKAGYVRAVAFSPDGRILASGGDDVKVRLWDVAARKELDSHFSYPNLVFSLAFSPDGRTLASGGTSRTLKLWDIATRTEVATLSGEGDTGEIITAVAFSPDGKTLASSCDEDRTVKLWNVAERRELATLSGHSKGVFSVKFSPDGKILATGSDDHTLKLWDTSTRKEVATLAGHLDSVVSVAFSSDGKTLASTSEDNTVKLWDIAARKELGTLSGHSSPVYSVTFSPDGRTLASTSFDQTVKLWNTSARKQVATLLVDLKGDENDEDHFSDVYSVVFSPDGKTLASGGYNGSPSGGSMSKGTKLWDTGTRNEMTTGNFACGGSSVAFSPDGKTLASTCMNQSVRFWDLATRNEVATLFLTSRINSVAFSPDGKTVASASDDRAVTLWDTATHKKVATLSGHSGPVSSVAFSPDGKLLASASEDKTVWLWDTATHQAVATPFAHSDSVLSVAFSPDGKTLVSASRDKTVKLWDIAARKELATLSGHSDAVTSVAFSPDGKTLASASDDRAVKLWDTATHKEVATLSDHSDYVLSVAFSPDGKTLASVSRDGTIKLWLAATEAEVEKRRRR